MGPFWPPLPPRPQRWMFTHDFQFHRAVQRWRKQRRDRDREMTIQLWMTLGPTVPALVLALGFSLYLAWKAYWL